MWRGATSRLLLTAYRHVMSCDVFSGQTMLLYAQVVDAFQLSSVTSGWAAMGSSAQANGAAHYDAEQ